MVRYRCGGDFKVNQRVFSRRGGAAWTIAVFTSCLVVVGPCWHWSWDVSILWFFVGRTTTHRGLATRTEKKKKVAKGCTQYHTFFWKNIVHKNKIKWRLPIFFFIPWVKSTGINYKYIKYRVYIQRFRKEIWFVSPLYSVMSRFHPTKRARSPC